jgi:hypothetical protein
VQRSPASPPVCRVAGGASSASRREDAITAVTNVIANDNPNARPGDTMPRELVTAFSLPVAPIS